LFLQEYDILLVAFQFGPNMIVMLHINAVDIYGDYMVNPLMYHI